MAATTFTWIPTHPATQASKPNVRTVKFGDGYEQRIRYGLRNDFKEWSLIFSNRDDTERAAILAFLSERGGAEQFNWTTPHGATSAFVCSEWTSEYANCNNNNIQATFRQVIDL